MKLNRKGKIPHTFRETNFQLHLQCFSSYKNRELKVKLSGVGARERKKSVFFVPLVFYLNV